MTLSLNPSPNRKNIVLVIQMPNKVAQRRQGKFICRAHRYSQSWGDSFLLTFKINSGHLKFAVFKMTREMGGNLVSKYAAVVKSHTHSTTKAFCHTVLEVCIPRLCCSTVVLTESDG